ncbi:DUF3291 domain-containing protein [Actinomarinicola tropica]|uniref:DUF3291 domain-containing protein n=1 Tax=Actinomarinicola tropica TaxID=2789776 RepID=A0A5Q2RKN6_9ACTN|nr:DUF3291 domain-containing protein [Actinomarinicola tropica]QGG94420.1 DUF3291 domain-containing protein [Actinomarinicola tropica]
MRTPTQTGTHDVDGSTQLVTMASRLELRCLRDVPAFLRAALRLQRRFAEVDGGVRLDLEAHPLRRTFFTLSTWRDQASLDAYAADPLHRDVMRAFRSRMAGSTFVTWTHDPAPLPGWTDARERLDRADREENAAERR